MTLAIEGDDGCPPSKKIKTSEDQQKRLLLEIWEKEPDRVTTEDMIYEVDEYSQFPLSRVKLDGECLGLMRCNHPICAKKPLQQQLSSIWFSNRSGAPHKYSVRRHHEQNHYDKFGERAATIKAAALMIADGKLPLDSWSKPCFKNFLSTVGPLKKGSQEIYVEEIVMAMKNANRSLSETHRKELHILALEHLIYEVDPNMEVKIEDQENLPLIITELPSEIGVEIPSPNDKIDIPLSEVGNIGVNRQFELSGSFPSDITISSVPLADLLDAAPTLPDRMNTTPPTPDRMDTIPPSPDRINIIPPSPDRMNSIPPSPNISFPKAVSTAVAEVQTDGNPLEDNEDFKDNPDPGEGSHLYNVYERWSPILSPMAKDKLIEDFSLNDPLYQSPEDIEDDELKAAVRDEWVHAFPMWLDNFVPINAKNDGYQKIPLSDILALRRMYKSELQKRGLPVSS